MGSKRQIRAFRLTGAFLGLALTCATPAFADTYRVTKRGDPAPAACTDNDCSLREAVLAANARPGPDRVVLPSRRTYQLSIPGDDDGAMVGDLDVTNDRLRIFHPGDGRPRIDFNPPADGFPDPLDRVFEVFSPLTLEKLVITDGGDPSTAGGDGAGIRATADLTLKRTRVVGNESPRYGGGVQVQAAATFVLRNSVVANNSASSCGGGIHTQDDVELTIVRSRVSGNRAGGDGGGISHSCFGGAGALRISRSAISDNVGDSNNDDIGRGGGMYIQTGSGIKSTISNTTISGNRTGSEGGGFYTDLGRLRVSSSTVSGNRSRDAGGGVSVDGSQPLVMVNSTVTRNRADSVGGGIHGDSGEVRINSLTVARNRGNADGIGAEAGGGLYSAGIPFTVENSLIALNSMPPLGPGLPTANDCAGTNPFLSLGHNLLSTRYLCDGFDAPGDIKRSNPKLAKLAGNGGPTRTIALKNGSPAIGRADPGSSPGRDQRGVKRQNPDIGAFELD